MIFKKIGLDINTEAVEVIRLGRKQTGPTARPRAVKVITSNPQQRKQVLDHSKNLKEAGNAFKKIYIKKDIHPVVRKELNRLKSLEYEEKQKPENTGRTVKYDHVQRCVTVDDIVIDRFNMAFF